MYTYMKCHNVLYCFEYRYTHRHTHGGLLSTCCQNGQLEFHLHDPLDGMRGSTLKSCPLTSTGTIWHPCTPPQDKQTNK